MTKMARTISTYAFAVCLIGLVVADCVSYASRFLSKEEIAATLNSYQLGLLSRVLWLRIDAMSALDTEIQEGIRVATKQTIAFFVLFGASLAALIVTSVMDERRKAREKEAMGCKTRYKTSAEAMGEMAGAFAIIPAIILLIILLLPLFDPALIFYGQ